MIELHNLHFAYSKGAVALNDVTATFPPGIHLLLGENGAGKTTLLRIMAGLLFPSGGCCLIDGSDVALRRPSVMSRLFFMGDEMVFPARTVNILARIHGCFYPEFDRDMLAANLREFGMTGDEPLDRMSLGMRRKAQLAYALALRVEVLLLDEPVNGLDIQSKQTFARLLAASSWPGQTVIISTHTVGDLENLFDGVALISGGRMLLQASLDDVAVSMAFVSSLNPVPDAIYQEINAGLYRAVVAADSPAAGIGTGAVDITLLYNAMMNPSRQDIISLLSTPHSSSHEHER